MKAALYTPYRPNLVAQSAWFTDDFFSCDTQPSPAVIIGASAPIHKTRKPSAITPEGVTFKKVHDAGPINCATAYCFVVCDDLASARTAASGGLQHLHHRIRHHPPA